jgi:hypothetical protein
MYTYMYKTFIYLRHVIQGSVTGSVGVPWPMEFGIASQGVFQMGYALLHAGRGNMERPPNDIRPFPP